MRIIIDNKVKKPNRIKVFFRKLRETYISDGEMVLAMKLMRSNTFTREISRGDRMKEILEQLNKPEFKKYFYHSVNFKRKQSIKKISKVNIFLQNILSWFTDKYFYLFENKIWKGRQKLMKIKRGILLNNIQMDEFIKSKTPYELQNLMVDRGIIGESVNPIKIEDDDRFNLSYDYIVEKKKNELIDVE